MNDCQHMNLVRVAEFDGTGPRPPSKDGVFTYYCKECHFTLYLKFTEAPPITVSYGTPKTTEEKK